MMIAALGFLIGNFVLHYCSSLPKLIYLIIAFCIVLIIRFFIVKKFHNMAVVVLAVIAGMMWSTIYIQHASHWKFSKALIGHAVIMQGYVASLPKSQFHKINFIIETKSISHRNLRVKLKLNWYGKHPQLHMGDYWRLLVKLKQPRGTLNPGGFDYEQYLFSQGVAATGYVRKSKLNQLISSNDWDYALERLREWLLIHMQQQLKHQAMAGIIIALAIGSRVDLSASQWNVFRMTGTSHLVAISGLHIGLVAGFVYLSMSFLWRLFPRLTLYRPAPDAAAIAGFIAAIIYSALAGFALPTQRALIMIACFMLGTLLRRNLTTWTSLMLALLLVLIWDPLASYSVSFWLSFGAVALILYGTSHRLNPRSVWWQWGRTQWVVVLGLLPLSLVLFQMTSLVAFITNMLAIPWVGFVVVPLSLVGCLSLLFSTKLASWVLWLAAHAMGLLWYVMHWLAFLKYSVWQHAIANPLIFSVTILGMSLLLAPRGLPARYLCCFWLMPLFFYQPNALSKQQWRFTLLDVGQGLAAVIQTQNHVLVYDTGPKFSPQFDLGDSVVVPYLRYLGVHKIDQLVISHADMDHRGGARSVLTQMRVNTIETTVTKLFTKNAQRCNAGEQWQWDGLQFRYLFPPKYHQLTRNDSCVLRISDGHTSILLPGDIQMRAEQYLIKHDAKLLHATILIAPHHGSKTSSTPDFIKAVKADYVLYSIGFANRFNHPHISVHQRYVTTKAIILDTAHSGAITFIMNKSNAPFIERVQQYRHQHHYFYRSQG